ncbi:transmembrane signal receptor [Lithospermum erythrorhizon]|uniref:non-specific serine/threonine protein kinase n=1 Tax=Lithospermum erythrorhizon TaxID=34254 RepID=A0AAV3S397_LITER
MNLYVTIGGIWLLIYLAHVVAILAFTNTDDFAALTALKSSWDNLPPNWNGPDPCVLNWEGVICTNSRVTSLKLNGMGISGSQFGDLASLTELEFLDLSNNLGLKGTLPSSIGELKNLTVLMLIGCSFFGPIPTTIGSLKQLTYISLSSNNFTGLIPPSIGNLSKLSWLDLSDNQLNGPIPVNPGMDSLGNARHFHFSNNQLSGSIPPELFGPNMKLIHVMFDNNRLVGNIPPDIGNVKSLEVVRLDRNLLNGEVPEILNSLGNITDLYLANNKLLGQIPNLTGMPVLSYVDMSNNTFEESDVPSWFTSLQSLTTLVMENTQLIGEIPVNFFSLPHLEKVVLSNNKLSGTLDIGSSDNTNLTVDLSSNSITNVSTKAYKIKLSLLNNPVCPGGESSGVKYCTAEKDNSYIILNSCTLTSCSSDRVLSPKCSCSHPYTGNLWFFSSSFLDLGDSSYHNVLEQSLLSAFKGLPVDSVNVSHPSVDINSHIQYQLQIFPSGKESFNRTEIAILGFLLNRQNFSLPSFGPFLFIENSYCCFSDGVTGAKKSSNTGAIVGASVGCVLFILLLCVGIYAFRQRRSAKRESDKNNPFLLWDSYKGNGAVPQLKGAKWFSFEELRNITNNFSESHCIGSGGYGKVYKGTLTSGEVVAIKRAQQGSMQGAAEFRTEIELLSRIHHKNVVSLVGFCYEQGEQMLVYEFIHNGTLGESLSGKSGIKLGWSSRLKVALDAARGLLYLHELANPPIIHRDIKSNNILLDDQLNAKVADFGLSKLLGDTGKGYVTTQVKGTLVSI